MQKFDSSLREFEKVNLQFRPLHNKSSTAVLKLRAPVQSFPAVRITEDPNIQALNDRKLT